MRASIVAATLVALSASGAAAVTPGALGSHRFSYADEWRGWPVSPKHRQHPVRGSFLDPRRPNYHWGIDIAVRDDRPAGGAPPGRAHRVFAIEAGFVRNVRDGPFHTCFHSNLEVGHFAYWHVDATVRAGQRVRPGQMIGWSCAGQWHVHLGEWASVDGRRVWVNPFHRGGKVRPYRDTAPPVIHSVDFRTPAIPPSLGQIVSAERLRGVVDLRAWVSDPQSFHGWLSGRLGFLSTDHHPYEVTVRIRHRPSGRVRGWTVFRGDIALDEPLPSRGLPIPLDHHYSPGTRRNLKTSACLRARRNHPERPPTCRGTYQLRLFASATRAYWDTRLWPNGRYLIAVSARDVRGNSSGVVVAEARVVNRPRARTGRAL